MIEASKFLLEPLFLQSMHEIGQFVRETASVEMTSDLFDNLIITFQAQVLAGKADQNTYVHEVQHPASWWQHLKHSHAPEWFKRRWPVRHEATKISIDWKQFAAYPKADIGLPAPKFGYPITIPVIEEPRVLGGSWAVTRLPDEPSKPAYQSRHELVSRLYGTEAMRSLERSSMTDYPPSPQAMVYVVLDGLEELGVNPNELLRTTA